MTISLVGEHFLVWSNEHRSWWGPNFAGYTGIIGKAGRYTRDEAERICKDANRHIDPNDTPNEVMVLAPEAIPARR